MSKCPCFTWGHTRERETLSKSVIAMESMSTVVWETERNKWLIASGRRAEFHREMTFGLSYKDDFTTQRRQRSLSR